MLRTEDGIIKEKLLDGAFGLEKENLRVLKDGTLSRTPHPFPGDRHIVRDFSENQIEINTSPYPTAEEAMEELHEHEERLIGRISGYDEPEFLWPFSNPPYIDSDSDIPIAKFEGEEAGKTVYREHLAEVYGRHKMTFSGIHVNYSFSDELLKREALMEKGGEEGITEDDYRRFKDSFYVDLAAKMSKYGWLLVLLTAASPMADGSYYDVKRRGVSVDTGMSSLRCSEEGYWNSFDPVLDYSDISKYADSIERYVDEGVLDASTELYYPVRLKPSGMYDVKKLGTGGADHIELRMFDLDPLVPEGLDVRDVEFARLMMVYMGAGKKISFDEGDQIDAIHNFKSAAHYDLDGTMVNTGESGKKSLREAARALLNDMKSFYEETLPDDDGVLGIIDFELGKVKDDGSRYATRILSEYKDDYVEKVLRDENE